METTINPIMDIHITVEPVLIQNQTQVEIESKTKTALVIFEYLQGELSIGEVAEYYKKSIEDTMSWLNSLGIPGSRSMGSDLDQMGYDNIRAELKERGVTHP